MDRDHPACEHKSIRAECIIGIMHSSLYLKNNVFNMMACDIKEERMQDAENVVFPLEKKPVILG